MHSLLLVIPSPVLGGAERQTLQVARGLSRKGFAVTLCAVPALLAAAGPLAAGCAAWPLQPGPEAPAAAARAQQRDRVATALAALRPDAALLCAHLPGAVWGALEALDAAAIPALSVVHLVREDWFLPAAERALAGRLRAGWAALSPASARRLERLFGLPPGRVAVLPNGPAPAPPPAPDRRRFGLPEGMPLLVQAGRLDARKGAHLAPAIARHLDDGWLVLAGEGPLAPALAGHPRLFCLGHVPDVPALLACAQACLLPSAHEGAPLVLAEAALAGCPIIATREALEAWPAPEAVARIVPRAPAAIARAFAGLLAAPEAAAAQAVRARAQALVWDEACMVERTAMLLAVEAAAWAA